MADVKIESITFNERELNKFCEELVDEMLAVAKEKVTEGLSTHVDTGATIASIKTTRKGNEGTISVGENAVWLEFGTGVAKNPTAYPVQVDGIVPHGTYGKGNGANPNGWNYPKDGRFYHTKGIAQTRFMYNTGRHLEENAQEIANKVASKWSK